MNDELRAQAVWIIGSFRDQATDPEATSDDLRTGLKEAAVIIEQLVEWNDVLYDVRSRLQLAFWIAMALISGLCMALGWVLA